MTQAQIKAVRRHMKHDKRHRARSPEVYQRRLIVQIERSKKIQVRKK